MTDVELAIEKKGLRFVIGVCVVIILLLLSLGWLTGEIFWMWPFLLLPTACLLVALLVPALTVLTPKVTILDAEQQKILEELDKELLIEGFDEQKLWEKLEQRLLTGEYL